MGFEYQQVRFAFYRYYCISRAVICCYYDFVFGTNKLQIFTASFNKPPGCPLDPKLFFLLLQIFQSAWFLDAF
jgi:hypothetical protein